MVLQILQEKIYNVGEEFIVHTKEIETDLKIVEILKFSIYTFYR